MGKKVIALGLVPLDEVEDVFCSLLEQKPEYEQLEIFADYVLETYIESGMILIIEIIATAIYFF